MSNSGFTKRPGFERELAGTGYLSKLDAIQVQPHNISQFSEQLVVNRFPLIELSSIYGTSLIRDVVTTSNSATITSSSTGEILISTGTTASSTGRLDSAERIRYLPGFGAEVGIGIRIPTLPTGNQEAKWGIRSPDGNEGLYWGVDATGVYTAVVRNGTETKTRPSSFTIDSLDGSGSSGLTLVLSEGNIFQIDFTWYGYGQVRYDVIDIIGHIQQVVSANTFKPSGATSIQTPNVPIFVEVTNGGDASDFEVYVGGRQACVIGNYNPAFRPVGQERAAVSTSTTSVPLISFRNKSGFENRNLKLDSATSRITGEDHIIEFYLNPTLTGASWDNPTNNTAGEVATEVDTSATALTGGTLVFDFPAYAGDNKNQPQTNPETLDFNVPENQIITMAARTRTGTGTADGYFRLREEW